MLFRNGHTIAGVVGPACIHLGFAADSHPSGDVYLMTIIKLVIIPSWVEFIELTLVPRQGVRTLQVEKLVVVSHIGLNAIKRINDFSVEGQESVVMAWIEQKGYKLGDVMNAFRLALVGIGKGPGMFDISAFLGKEETLRRLRRAIDVLK